MSDRVGDLNLFNTSIRHTTRNRLELIQAQERVSTGKRINALADDPTGVSRSLSLGRTLEQLDQLQRNGAAAQAFMDNTLSSLSSLSDILVTLKETALAAANGTNDSADLMPIVEELHEGLLQIANTRVGGRALFGGHQTETSPFSQAGSFVPGTPGPPPSVSYSGDSGAIEVQVGDATRIQINVTGRAVFFGSSDGDDIPDGNGVDIFQAVQDLRDQLLPGGDPSSALDEIDRAIDQVIAARGELGSRTRRLELTRNQLQDLAVSVQAERAAIEDVDLVEAIAELTQREQTFQAALGVTARVLQPTLLNFLT